MQIHRTSPRNKTRDSVWNLIQWQEFWIQTAKFDTTTRKLNRQYGIQLAVIKTRFFACLFQILTIVFWKTYFSRFLTTSVEQLFRRAPFDGCSWQYIGGKQCDLFRQILILSEKPVYAPVCSLFENPNNQNSFKQFVANSLYPNYKEGY